MKKKVSELEGEELDHWVALALGYQHLGAVGVSHENKNGIPWCLSKRNDWWKGDKGEWICGPCEGFPRSYSTDWSQGGPIIEREQIAIHAPWDDFHCENGEWNAETKKWGMFGPTPLIAAMRAYVATKFGEEVEVKPLA